MKKDTHITTNSQPSTLNSQLAYAISRWAEEDRPREKLRDKGAETLTDAELLAILIGSGSTKESAVQLMQRIISDCDGNLNTLGKMQLRELTAYNGIGEAKSWASDELHARLPTAPTWVRRRLYTTSCTPRCRTSTRRKHGCCS